MRLLRSFKYAFEGLFYAIRTQKNFRIHILAGTLVGIAGIYYRIELSHWAILSICIGMVMSAELFNSAIEILCDKICPEKDPVIKRIKDLSAAAVLILSMAAVAVGIFIFSGYIF